ncbi:MAG: MltA domain-containing protein, partial [Planctomycetota bacterium]
MGCSLPALLGAITLFVAACVVYPPVRVEESNVDWGRPLPRGAAPLIPLSPGEPVPDLRATWVERDELLPALERSIQWTRRKHAVQFFPAAGITHERALRSLEAFRALLDEAPDALTFQRRFEQRFEVLKSAGWDGAGGGVLFTGYCTPILPGSLTRGGPYQHALHALPPDLVKAPDGTTLGQETPGGMRPYPSRADILANEEYDALALVWLSDPLDAYIAHVNGSAFVELPSGELARFGYAGKNGRPYTSLGKALIASG